MDIETARIEHLKLIQGIIERMGRNSFAIKAGAVTISAAVAAVAPGSTFVVSIGGVVLILVLWALDAFYLRQERAFRGLYDKIRTGLPADFGNQDYFSMAAEPDRSRVARIRSTLSSMFAASLLILYVALVLFQGALAVSIGIP